MFTKSVSAFKLLLVVFTLVVCSSVIFIPPSFAGEGLPIVLGSGDSSTPSGGSSTPSDNSVPSECASQQEQQNC